MTPQTPSERATIMTEIEKTHSLHVLTTLLAGTTYPVNKIDPIIQEYSASPHPLKIEKTDIGALLLIEGKNTLRIELDSLQDATQQRLQELADRGNTVAERILQEVSHISHIQSGTVHRIIETI